MGSALPTLLVVGVMAFGGYLLINPELRCQVLGLCGSTTRVAEPPVKEEEPEDNNDDPTQPPIVNVCNPAPIITPAPIIVRPQYFPATRSAVNDCCECRTFENGRVYCKSSRGGSYNLSYASARYDPVEAAAICARNQCYHPKPRPQPQPPQPPTCRTQINRHDRTYYITNLRDLPIQTMQFPPTYIKEGNCVYQLVQSSPPPAPNNPKPHPGPKTNDCDDYLCKTYPFLCPKCTRANATLGNAFYSSLYNTGKIAY